MKDWNKVKNLTSFKAYSTGLQRMSPRRGRCLMFVEKKKSNIQTKRQTPCLQQYKSSFCGRRRHTAIKPLPMFWTSSLITESVTAKLEPEYEPSDVFAHQHLLRSSAGHQLVLCTRLHQEPMHPLVKSKHKVHCSSSQSDANCSSAISSPPASHMPWYPVDGNYTSVGFHSVFMPPNHNTTERTTFQKGVSDEIQATKSSWSIWKNPTSSSLSNRRNSHFLH